MYKQNLLLEKEKEKKKIQPKSQGGFKGRRGTADSSWEIFRDFEEERNKQRADMKNKEDLREN